MRFRRMRGRRFGAKVTAVFAMLAAIALISSCSSYDGQVHANGEFGDMIKPALAFTDESGKPLQKGEVGVQPGAPIVVTATEGTIRNVNIPKSDGTPIKGVLSEDGTKWTSAEPFGYDRSYTVTADAIGVGGTTTSKSTFTTRAPNNVTQAYISPPDGETVGIAQTIGVRFDEAIPDRKAAQAAIKITSTPKVEGAFYWISDQEVRWRPEHFWKPGTKVSVTVNTFGIDLGDGLFGQENVSSSFKVGRQMELFADDNTKMVTVKRDGKVIRTMPTSMGKESAPTDNGIYIIGDRLDHIIMDSSTYGVPTNSADGYRTPVDYATQMSYSGIYLHSAPWSVWAQGNTNTSHGCLNLSPDDALWVVRNTLRGDPVTVKNTIGPELPGTDGLGDWNIPWSTWSKGNA
ncbi:MULTISPECIES: L,D-transpeptidase [Gordonia]|uniref:L,D-transpeptidase n=1 Tax=Gordonia TaxID=2053 RepID=UPI0005EE58B5|nr:MULTISPECIES: Ig-like domain-containing protein [Gordonia]KJR03618.1 ErfK/YbiS/YcfS/YnhG family protein [Gordonia sihwensis]KXT56553.1 ErfK/YbiS/YcfS/YnhG family protein [Gordonia sp. QH-12]